MTRATRFGRVLGQFRWWSLLIAVLAAIAVGRWFDGHLGDDPGAELPANLAISRSFPSPATGLVINLERFGCSDDPQICSLEFDYENIGGLADSEAGGCPVDPARFMTLVDQQGRHYSPGPKPCPSLQPDWAQQVGQPMPAAADFRLPTGVAASRLLVVGQLIDLQDPSQTIAAQTLGEAFGSRDGAINYRLVEFDCQVLADGSRDEAYRWWRRLTNEANNDHYNPDRNLTTGEVFNSWQVCRLVVDYENSSPDGDIFWGDNCQAAVYRNIRLVDGRGWQYQALGDRICQPGSIAWPPGSRTRETIEFVIDRLVEIERVLLVDQLVSVPR